MVLFTDVTNMPGSTCHMSTERTGLTSHTLNNIDKSRSCLVLGSANRLHINAAESQLIFGVGAYKVAGLLME